MLRDVGVWVRLESLDEVGSSQFRPRERVQPVVVTSPRLD